MTNQELIAQAAIDEYSVGDCKSWYDAFESPYEDDFYQLLLSNGIKSVSDLDEWFKKNDQRISEHTIRVFQYVLDGVQANEGIGRAER